jgi:deazaflavin-dependent oxidoreductase (nitroreductase family)
MTRLPRRFQLLAASGPATWLGLHVASKIDPWLLKRTRGRLSTVLGQPVLLLAHSGAKSGQPRETALFYATDGAAVVLVASNGGRATHPAWYHNLLANPECRILAKGCAGTYRARAARGAERDRLWRLAVDVFGGYELYRARAGGRVIPVVVLEPLDAPRRSSDRGAALLEQRPP